MPSTLLDFSVVEEAAAKLGDVGGSAISRRSGVSQATLSRLKRGRVKPTLDTLLAFRLAYRISLDSMLPKEPAA